MHTEETQAKKDKDPCTDFGCSPMGQKMFEMMSKCCAGKGEFPVCSITMKSMIETAKNQPCCTPKTADAETEGRIK